MSVSTVKIPWWCSFMVASTVSMTPMITSTMSVMVWRTGTNLNVFGVLQLSERKLTNEQATNIRLAVCNWEHKRRCLKRNTTCVHEHTNTQTDAQNHTSTNPSSSYFWREVIFQMSTKNLYFYKIILMYITAACVPALYCQLLLLGGLKWKRSKRVKNL